VSDLVFESVSCVLSAQVEGKGRIAIVASVSRRVRYVLWLAFLTVEAVSDWVRIVCIRMFGKIYVGRHSKNTGDVSGSALQ
jgi:hypothetical protein